MHRPLWYRAVVALWGLWITTALVEPAGFAACAMHSGPTMQRMAAPPAASARPSADDEHARHGAVATVANADHGDTPPPASHHCCTCLGSCCASTPVAAPAVAVVPAEPTVRRAAHPRSALAERPNTERPHALPFAIGPPIVRG